MNRPLDRVVAVLAAAGAVGSAVAYQLLVQGFGTDQPSLGDPQWDRDAFQGELLSTFFPLLLCGAMLVWGFFQMHQAFVAAVVGAVAFAGFTAGTSYSIDVDTSPLRLVGFITMVAPGQLAIVVTASGLALFARWWAHPPANSESPREHAAP